MTELKPCPFCGGKAEVFGSSGDFDWYAVECENGNCCASTKGSSTEAEAIEAWNRREGEK